MDQTKKWDIASVQKEFGPLKLIDRKREAVLRKREGNFVLTIMSYDVPYEDLDEDERPTEKELEERGETPENYTQCFFYAEVGHHIVNVEHLYESKKPMPPDLKLDDEGIWHGEDGLPE